MVSANPTGPITVAHARNGAYGDSVARLLEFAGHDVEREYYGNDGGTQMERFHASVDALRRGEAPPEDGYHGDVHARARGARRATPCPQMLASIEESLDRFRSTSTPGPARPSSSAEIPAAMQLLDTYEEDGRRLGTDERARRRQGPGPRPLGRRADLLRARTPPTSVASSPAGSTARLRPRRRSPRLRQRACRRSPRCSGTTPKRSRCSSTSSSSSSRAARRRRCRSGAATSCLSTSCSTRSASTPRAGTSSRAATTRRSSSTSTSPRNAPRRTLSTTSSTRTRASLGSSGTRRCQTRCLTPFPQVRRSSRRSASS